MKGRHLGLFVPRDSVQPAEIVHECQTPGCEVTRWNERARNTVPHILNDWGRNV